MCLQYWRSVGQPRKQRLMTWRGGYHGDTWQPMSVCDPDGGMHELWQGALPRQMFVGVRRRRSSRSRTPGSCARRSRDTPTSWPR